MSIIYLFPKLLPKLQGGSYEAQVSVLGFFFKYGFQTYINVLFFPNNLPLVSIIKYGKNGIRTFLKLI